MTVGLEPLSMSILLWRNEMFRVVVSVIQCSVEEKGDNYVFSFHYKEEKMI